MITLIVIIVVLVILIKAFGPVLLDILSVIWSILIWPISVIGGLLGFILEAGLFVGLLWLVVTIFGL